MYSEEWLREKIVALYHKIRETKNLQEQANYIAMAQNFILLYLHCGAPRETLVCDLCTHTENCMGCFRWWEKLEN